MSVHGHKLVRSLRKTFNGIMPLSLLFGAVAAFCIGHSWQLVSGTQGSLLEGFTRISSQL